MRCVVQRVSSASVSIGSEVVGSIEHGLLALVGIGVDDTEETVDWMADKVVRLRIFNDEDGRFDRSLLDVGGSLLSVSQFTLFGDARKGTRPSFTAAARPELAIPMWERFNARVRAHEVGVATGRFAADMQVALVNDGPVTLTLER